MNKFLTKIAALSVGLAMAIGVGVAVGSGSKSATRVHATNADYSFAFSTMGSTGWGTGYADHTGYDDTVCKIDFKSASKQTGTITTVPVTKAGDTTVVLKSGYTMSSVTFTLSQWASKAKTVSLQYSTNGGTSYSAMSPAVSSSNFTLSSNSLPTGTNAVKMVQGNTSNQVGISSVSFVYSAASTPLTGITLGGAASQNAMSIGSSDLTAKTVSVTLNPSGATDQKVNITHQSGTSGLFTVSSSATCTSGSGSFTVTGKGNTSGSETFRIKGNTETSVYVDLVVTAFDDSATYWTVSFDSNGGSVTPEAKSIEDGTTFTFPSAGTKAHHTFSGWKSPSDANLYAVGATSPAVTADIAYTAQWTPDPQVTVTYKAGDGTGSDIVSSEYVGTYSVGSFPTGWSAPSGKTFSKWSDGTNEYAPNASYTLVANTNVTFTAVYASAPDILNQSWTGVTGTSYVDWSNKAGSSSDAVYAGNSAGSNSSIQLRSNNSNSGVVSTTSGGKVRKIVVTWESNTQSGRTLNVYGNNSAYESPTQLYSSSTQGTLLGTIVCGTSTELDISNDYSYVGFRSADGAMYLSEVDIYWEEVAIPQLAAPVISISNNVVSWSAVPNASTYTYSITGTASKSDDVSVLSLNVNELGLDEGSYSITLVSKGDGVNYRTSVASNSLNFTIDPSPEVFPDGDPYPIELSSEGGTHASAATINVSGEEYSGIKAGTSSNSGAVKITLGSGADGLSFRAAGWNGESVTLTITGSLNNLSENTIELTADSGLAGNTPFTLTGSKRLYLFTFTFDPILADTEITLTATTGKRFAVWDAIYYISGQTVPSITLAAEDDNPNVDVDYTTTIIATRHDGATGTISWTTSNSSILEIVTSPATGDQITVRGKAQGVATITATLTGCSDATILITVNDPSAPIPPEGTKATWVAADQGYENQQVVSSTNILSSDITAEFDENKTKYYDTGSAIRVYGGTSFTITSVKANIKSVVFTFASGGNANEISSDVGTMSADSTTWSPSSGTMSSSITFTLDGTSGHRRVAQISVGYYGAEEFAYEFLLNTGCTQAGTTEPTINWSSYQSKYGLLFTSEQSTLKLATADEHSTSNIEKAMARYDYIVGKYNKTMGLTTQYPDFIDRNPAPRGNNRILASTVIGDSSNIAAIVIVISAISVTAIGGYFFLRKRKEQ